MRCGDKNEPCVLFERPFRADTKKRLSNFTIRNV